MLPKATLYIVLACTLQSECRRHTQKFSLDNILLEEQNDEASDAGNGQDQEDGSLKVDGNHSSDTSETVQILFIRHGHACHNALKYQSRSMTSHCVYPDPPLTDCGVSNSHINGQALRRVLALNRWTPDFVGSSAMIRAIETAGLFFPASVIHPLPFIKEDSTINFACNHVQPIAVQKEWLDSDSNTHKTAANFGYVSWKGKWTVKEAGWGSRAKAKWTSEQARSAALFKEFLAFLSQQVLVHGNRRIAIVSHSSYLLKNMKKYLYPATWTDEDKKMKLKNNGAVMFEMTYDSRAARKLTPKTLACGGKNKEQCITWAFEKNGNGPQFGRNGWRSETVADWDTKADPSKNYLCPRDYDRCTKTTFGDKMMMLWGGSKIRPAPRGKQCCTAR